MRRRTPKLDVGAAVAVAGPDTTIIIIIIIIITAMTSVSMSMSIRTVACVERIGIRISEAVLASREEVVTHAEKTVRVLWHGHDRQNKDCI